MSLQLNVWQVVCAQEEAIVTARPLWSFVSAPSVSSHCLSLVVGAPGMVQGLLQQLSWGGGTAQVVRGGQGHALASLSSGQIQILRSYLGCGLQPNGMFFWITEQSEKYFENGMCNFSWVG